MIKIFGLIIERNKSREKAQVFIEDYRKERRRLYRECERLGDKLGAIKDVAIPDRLDEILKKLDERNRYLDGQGLDIVFKSNLTVDGVIKALKELQGDVQKTGVLKRKPRR